MQASYEVGELEQIYLSTIQSNLDEIELILTQVGLSNIPLEQFKDILHQSSQSLTQRWQTGRKVARTQIARMLIPNYPDSVLTLSLTIDAIINLLDDLLDEILAKEQKAAYILEMVRILSLLNHLKAPPHFQQRIASYFNKCICIVIPEIVYKDKIKAEPSFEKRLQYTIQCYDAKSMDMDIFMELPLVEISDCSETVDELTAIARIHRAVALIKKDYNDLTHDKANQTETPLVLLSYEGEAQLHQYLDALMQHYARKNQALEITSEDQYTVITTNIRDLVNQELSNYRP